MATKLGSLTLDLIAKVSSFTGPMQEAENKAKSAGKGIAESMDVASLAVKSLGVAAAGVSIAGITNFANQTIQAGSDIKRFAELSNSSLQQFQYYAKGAETVGISMESFADKMKDMQDRIGDFDQTKGGPLADFFTNIAPKVGVTIQQFQKLSGPEALQLFYNSLEKTNASQNDMKFYMEAIISDSSLLIPLLRNGGEGFNKWGEAAKEAGAIMSDDFVESAVLAKEQLNLLNLKWEGFKNNAINDFAVPAITGLSDNIETVTNTLMISTAYMAGSYIPTMILGTKTLITDTVAKVANTVAERKKVVADYEVAKSNLAATAAMVRAMGTTNAQTAAMMTNARTAYQQAAAAKSAALANATLGGVLGGPIGLGVMAASAAAGFLLMKDSSKDTQSALEDQGLTVEELKVKYSQLNAEQLKLKALDAADAIEEQNEKISSSLTSLKQYISDLNAQGKTSEASSLQQYLDDLKTGGERAETAFSRLEKQSIVSPHSLKMAAQVGTNVKASNTEIEKQNQILSIASSKHIDHAKAAKTGAEGVALVGKEAVGAAAKVKNLGEEVQKFINDTLNSTTDNLRKYQLISQGYTSATADMILAAEKAEGVGRDSPFGKNAALSVFSTAALATQVLSQKRLTDLVDARTEAEKKANEELKKRKELLEKTVNSKTIDSLIARGEGDYNSFNKGKAGDSVGQKINLTNMTVGQIRSMQKDQGGSLYAVGKYQTIPSTLQGAIDTGIVSVAENFNAEVQERIVQNYLLTAKKGRGAVENYIRGNSENIFAANLDLAKEFASVASPLSGKSHYRNIGNNKASISVKEAQNALKASRELYTQAIASGKSAEEAWKSAFSGSISFIEGSDAQKGLEQLASYKKKLDEDRTALIEFYDDWQKLENKNSEAIKNIRETFAEDPTIRDYLLARQAQDYQQDVENYIKSGDDKVKAEYQATQEIIAARQAAYNSLNDPIYAMRDKGVEAIANFAMTPMQKQQWQLNNEQQDGYSGLANDLGSARSAIEDNELLTFQQKYEQLESAYDVYLQNKAHLDAQYDQQSKDLAQSQYESQLSMWGTLVGQAQNTWGMMTQAVKDANGEQSASFKTMFAMQQAFAIASAIINTEEAASKALTMGPVFGIPMSTLVRTMGYTNVAMIAAQSIAGMAHDGIDNIPSEGTWLLDGGERVLNPQQNKDLTNYLANSNGRNSQPIVNVHTLPGTTAKVNMRDDGALDIRIQEVAEQVITGQLRNPNSKISKSMNTNTTATRRR